MSVSHLTLGGVPLRKYQVPDSLPIKKMKFTIDMANHFFIFIYYRCNIDKRILPSFRCLTTSFASTGIGGCNTNEDKKKMTIHDLIKL
jgi:hypothetical protein